MINVTKYRHLYKPTDPSALNKSIKELLEIAQILNGRGNQNNKVNIDEAVKRAKANLAAANEISEDERSQISMLISEVESNLVTMRAIGGPTNGGSTSETEKPKDKNGNKGDGQIS